ncbi:MAG: Hint domain-containing protein [Paracoccaceae bacterium]|nr:Hint domain-containing protein [Paracoccaceae bacterium]
MPFFFDWSAYSDPNGTFTLNDGSEDLDVTVSAGSNQFIANMAGNDVLKSYDQTGPVSTTIGFDQVVQGVSFEIFDVDQGTDIEGWQGIGSGGWDDAITITAFDEAGNEIQIPASAITLTTHHSVTSTPTGTTIDSGGADTPNLEGTGAADTVLVTIDFPVASIQITHNVGDNGATSTGTIGVSDITIDTIVDPVDPAGPVDGEETSEAMILGYDDALGATDGGGDMITTGNDSILGNGGDDFIDGDAGDDTIDGGQGDDTIQLSDNFGDDTIAGDEDIGNQDIDTLSGQGITGEGVTVTFSGDESGTLTGNTSGDEAEFIEIEKVVTTDQDDAIDGTGSSNGIDVDAGDGDDTVTGGTGGDTIDGGDGDDDIDAGEGDDVIKVSTGDDTVDGGGGEDTFDAAFDPTTPTESITVHVTDDGDGTLELNEEGSVTDFTSVEDFVAGEGPNDDEIFLDTPVTDMADISGLDDSAEGTFTPENGGAPISFGPTSDTLLSTLLAGGYIPAGETDPIEPKGDFQITAGDEDGVIGDISFSNFETINFTFICFGRGTMIATDKGEKLIEELVVGDMVQTKDHGMQELRWVGSKSVPATRDLAPIVIKAGAMSNVADLTVSPQHRMLLEGWRAELLFSENEVLVAAKHLVNGDTIYRAEGGEVEYFHLLFDTHEVIYANGAPSESFHPGQQGFGALSEESRQEIIGLFPELATDASAYGPSVRTSLKAHEGKILADNPDFLR